MEPPDPVLTPFLSERDPEKRRQLLEALLVAVRPTLEQTLHRLLKGIPPADQEDLVAAGLASLAERLLGLELEPGSGPSISNLQGYASAVAYNLYRGYLRERHPQRARLVARVRYCLRADPRLALWVGPDGRACAGLAAWRARPAVEAAIRLDRLQLPVEPTRIALGDLIRRLCLHRGGPWPLPELLETLAHLLGARDLPPLSWSEDPKQDEEGSGSRARDSPEPAPSPERHLLDRERLVRLWQEVALLPLRQRQALLLNLRDARGGDLLGLFPLAGIATWNEIAGLLSCPVETLRALVPRLPLEDRELADWIGGVTQRQVINLRKTARARLERRLRS